MADSRDCSSSRSWPHPPDARWRTPLFSAAAVLSLLSVGALAGLASVQDDGAGPTTAPTTQPQADEQANEQEAGPSPDASRERGGRRGDREDRDFDRRDRDGFDGPEWREPTEEEWTQTVRFLEAHAPRRLALYQSWIERFRERQEARDAGDEQEQTQDHPREGQKEDQKEGEDRDSERRRPSIQAHIFHRIQMMQSLQEKDPSLYRFALQQFELEDQIIGGLQDVRQAEQEENQTALAAAEERVDAALRQYLENALDERRERIAHLERELAHEKERLSSDEENRDELMRRLERRFSRYLPPDGRRDRDGDDESRRFEQ